MIKKKYEFVVIGGGMSGICAAIAAARLGIDTALIHNRPVLGGNASSEIRMHICGASSYYGKKNVRETGIIEEILLENKRRNPTHSYPVFDSVLWEKVYYQENLTLYLNTHMTSVISIENKIQSIIAEQMTSGITFEISGDMFMDSTGDGTLGFLAGAEYMTGMEAKTRFGEEHAPEIEKPYLMGSTLMFKAKMLEHKVPFVKPFWANTYTEEDLALRDHSSIQSGYWWIELGGLTEDTIKDAEIIRDKLLKAVYGIWDHIKNSGNHDADYLDLEWVGFLPCKRESRRLVGDYVLIEEDCLKEKRFEDAIAYGGWPLDVHTPGGLEANDVEPTVYLRMKEVNTIPYRCLYSKNIENLFMGGRIISCSNLAFASTRVMGTCSVVGQAVGTAVAIAIRENINPREVQNHIQELQQELLKNSCYIPGVSNQDTTDIARQATVTANSFYEGYEAENVVNGIARPVGEKSNSWRADIGAELSLSFNSPQKINEIRITFDSNLSEEIQISIDEILINRQDPNIPKEMVKDYSVLLYLEGQLVGEKEIKDNHQRFNVIRLENELSCDVVKIKCNATHGIGYSSIFEVRLY